MAKIKLSKNLNQTQKTYLSFQSKLFIKLIKMNVNEINELVEKELEENPCLDEFQIQDKTSKIRKIESDKYIENEKILKYDEDNITSYVLKQINHLNISSRDKGILACLSYLINEKGFINYENTELKNIILSQRGINISEIEIEDIILRAQNDLDPPGIMTRNINECLKRQLILSNNINALLYSEIIDKYMEKLARKEFKEIAKLVGTSISQVKRCVKELGELNINPANIFHYNEGSNINVEPEAYVFEENGKLIIYINKEIKKVRISNYYKKMLSSKNKVDKEVKDYLKEKINNASLLLKTINEREGIYRNVIELLVKIQRDFIIKGERFIKPLKLSDVATEIGVHESTISRITSNKYISTPRGMINMKSLFVNKPSKDSEESSEAIRDIIYELIEKEDKSNPLTDIEIMGLLKNKNIKISRRTIAKYRNILRIPSSNKRLNK